MILIDEAVMVDTPRMAELLAAAGPVRYVCIGDPAQLQAIGAGGWYADQVARHRKIELTKVHRQRDQTDVEAFAALRSGDAAGAIASLASRGRVHIAGSLVERLGRVIADYIAHRDAGRSVSDVRIVLDGANTEIDTANRIFQQDRLRRGEITGPALELHSMTAGRSWDLHQGDEGSFLAPWSAPCANVYVANGTRARVEKIDHATRTVTLRLIDDGETVRVLMPEKAGEQVFGPSYAVHAQRLQGGEAPVFLAAPGKHTTSLVAGYS